MVTADERRERYTVAPVGTVNVKVSGPLVAGGNVSMFTWEAWD